LPIDFLEKVQTRLISDLRMGLGYHIKLKQLLVTGDDERIKIKKLIC